MSDDLIEAVARAVAEQMTALQGSERGLDDDLTPNERKFYFPIAHAAIAAIEASGTHRVVPVEPTDAMELAAEPYQTPLNHYRAMVAAAPKVIE